MDHLLSKENRFRFTPERSTRAHGLVSVGILFLFADNLSGAVAQLGEHLLCKQGVARSNRVSSISDCERAHSSVAEHSPDKAGVEGSIPSAPIQTVVISNR